MYWHTGTRLPLRCVIHSQHKTGTPVFYLHSIDASGMTGVFFVKNIREGSNGIDVSYLQLALKRAGYPVHIDGIFGSGTCKALQAYLGEDETCEVNEEVWEQLMPYLTGSVSHTVEAGDTLWSLAGKYHTTVLAIETANPQVRAEDLMIETELVIPLGFELVSSEVEMSSEWNAYILEGLLLRYPFLHLFTAGESVMGKPLYVLTIGEGEREVFYNAAFHANEWITTPVLLKFAEDYAHAVAAGRRIGQIPAGLLYEKFTLYLMPMVNPDGVDLVTGALNEGSYYENARAIATGYPAIPFPDGWKANIEGIDLNLQFPAGWEQAREIKAALGYVSPAPRDFPGSGPLTAPESETVYRFTLQHRFALILAYHTQGRVIYWKYLDYNPTDSYEIAQYFSSVSGYAVEETPSASGYAGYKDWFISNYNLPGYTIEAGEGENPLPLSQFDTIYAENLGILVGGMWKLLEEAQNL